MAARDPRYGTSRWRKTRLAVLRRDGEECWVPGCGRRATVADHIVPVSSGLSDFEFHSLSNLRASCMPHNVRRGVAERLARETEGVEAPTGFGRRIVHVYGRRIS